MKSLIPILIVTTLCGLSFTVSAETNSVPHATTVAKPASVTKSGPTGQKPSTVNPNPSASHQSEAQQSDAILFHRIKVEGLLTPPNKMKNNTEASLESIFQPNCRIVGGGEVRDTVVTIFPPGR